MYRRDGSIVAGLQAADRLFWELERAFDQAEEAALEGPGRLAFAGGPSYAYDAGAGAVVSDGYVIAGSIARFEVERDAATPRIFRVRVATEGVAGDEGLAAERIFERSFVLRNRGGRADGF